MWEGWSELTRDDLRFVLTYVLRQKRSFMAVRGKRGDDNGPDVMADAIIEHFKMSGAKVISAGRNRESLPGER